MELAERLEVEDMSRWSLMTSYPRTLKTLQIAAWRSPRPKAASRAVQRLAILAAGTTAYMASAGLTRGEVEDFDYNFEDLTLGNINGQDDWVVTSGTAWVQAGQGVNTSKTVNGPGGNSQDMRPLPELFHYTAADTAVVWQYQGLVGVSCCNSDSTVAFLGQSVNFGLEKTPQGILRANLRTDFNSYDGDALEFAHWYEIRVTIDFSVAGGLATLSYRDMTLGEDTFTVDKILRNINLNASPDLKGRYTYHTVRTRQDSANGVCWVDNIHFDAPIPPCTAHTGDMNADTAADGADVQGFTTAITAGSNAFADTCPGDFDDSGVVDPADVPGFVSALLTQ